MFKHILVATDGSPDAEKALAMALQLSDTARITLLTVVPDYGVAEFARSTFGQGPDVAHLREGLVSSGQRQLEEILARQAEPTYRVECLARVSDWPYQEIVDSAERLCCDLIVMGSRGRGALESMLLGSQTSRVLALAKLPVLVAR